MRVFKFVFPGLLLLSGAWAHSQNAGSMSFTVSPSTGVNSVTPRVRWTTSPVASTCAASGSWSGTKFASGSATLPKTTTSRRYGLTCSWGGGTAHVMWTKPTTNTDGSSLTNLSSFKVVYGTSASALNYSRLVSDPKATSVDIGSLGTGTWYFAVRAVNSAGAESGNSNVTTKVVSGAKVYKEVAVTVTH
jgi:hypothetical protein